MGQQAYFDIKVLNPNAESYSKLPIKIVYDRAKKAEGSGIKRPDC